jgi:hypothetical protein
MKIGRRGLAPGDGDGRGCAPGDGDGQGGSAGDGAVGHPAGPLT